MPLATAADLDHALRTAKRAFDVWRNTVPAERARILKGGADLIRERAARIAELLTLEEGKPLAESRDEVLRAAEYFEWFAEEARRIDGRVVPSNRPGVQQLVKKQAIGPVAAFTPWNFPAITPAWKRSAALAAGCSVIIKPGESPATALALARALDDAGLPKGVLQVVFGVPDEVSKTLIASPVIRKVTFTGSVPIGRLLAARAAEGVKPITLELGGHGPVLVFKDADVERAAVEGAANRFRGTGQVCISSTRFPDSARGLRRVRRPLRVGHPGAWAWATGCSPARRSALLANARQIAKMEELVADAIARGAKVLAGGKRIAGDGHFFEPTVLADVPMDARVMHEEPFGPIAVLMRFDELEDGLAEANRSPYGLSAYAFTSNARTAIDVGDGLEAGMIGINQYRIVSTELPFGGLKESGIGSEGGAEGIEFYLTNKFISKREKRPIMSKVNFDSPREAACVHAEARCTHRRRAVSAGLGRPSARRAIAAL